MARSPDVGICCARSQPPLLILLILLASRIVSAQPQQHGTGSEPLRWTTIEIVTNDFDSVERLRQATGIAGELLALDDPRVQQACDAVRRELPAKVVQCMQLFGDKVDGYVDAEYIVEIQDGTSSPPAPPHCTSTELAPDLIAVRNEWGRVVYATRPASGSWAERINAEQYLDYNSPERHQMAARMHAIVGTRIGELEKASTSCTAVSRADALYLMNFTGSPARAIQAAFTHMDDPDADVRNAATRLIGTFDGFIAQRQVAGIVRKACASAISGGFSDRNKSLVLLDRMRLRGLVSFGTLKPKCQEQIRAIARTSTAIQTGRAAQDLLQSADSQIRK